MIDVAEAAECLEELICRVALGEKIILSEKGEAIARLTPIAKEADLELGATEVRIDEERSA